ncbi:MAG TPA: dihydrolipoyl dehydrogenase [Candidatus Eisenbacteria bacterium]|nr:dihydrolipoyl dehydrogenase [Candidatus Eisenbacteria bacterium]
MARVDLVVIGAGPGGYTAAIRAAQLGMSVVCVEKDPTLGGTCLNVGCIPSKALLDSSEHYAHALRGLADHGVKVAGVTLDLPTMMTRKAQVVRGLTQGIVGLFKKHKIESVRGTARIAGPGRVVVKGEGGEQELETARILIATGSEATPLRGLAFDGDRIVSSTEALSLPSVPKRMLVVGGGAVGLELGSVWRRLGAEVTVVEFLPQIVPAFDKAVARLLQRSLEKQGIVFRLETGATGAERTTDGVRVTLAAKGGATETVEVDVVLVAVGRRPYTEGLGAREAGVTLDERGRIVVDARFETSVPGIFAIGDCIPGPMLAHKSEEDGIAAVEMMAGQPGHVDYDLVPNVVYTFPELASVGIGEDEAKRRGLAVTVGMFPFTANARARALGETEGQARIVADATTDRVLGVCILGPRASDMIAEAAIAMEFSASAEDIARTCHAHPTLPEAVREAALAVGKRTINI